MWDGFPPNCQIMSVKIRLARRGRKQAPIYDIVVADSRSPRDGRFIEKIGQYNPQSTPAAISLKMERALHWMMVGAQPTDTTRKILSVAGIMLKKHLQVGVNKGAITQEVADARFNAWLEEKEKARAEKIAKLSNVKESAKQAALEAERKKKEDMEAAKAKALAEAAAAETAVEETAAEETEAPAADDTAAEESTEA